jgi:hypothetical protein
MSQGTKGERLFDWAILPVVHGGTVDGCHFLVLRRCLDDPSELAFYLIFAPPGTSLHMMVLAIGARWSIEVDLENAKDLGLDHYEVRSYVGWYRHITLVLLAAAFLLSICLQDSRLQGPPEEPASSPPLISTSPLRSSSSPGSSHLACPHVRASDLSVVEVSTSASVLGGLLSPEASRESRIACSVFLLPGDLWGNFLFLFRLNTKGVLLMTILSLADCCRLLAIDPKTLRRWLHLAHLPVQAHPFDARLKCLTSEQVQQLAAMHRRTLPESSEPPFPAAPSAPSTPSDVIATPVWPSVVSEVAGPITELIEQLGSLQAQVVLLQHQLALLTEHVQKEQQWRTSMIKTFENNSLDQSAESSLDQSAESSLDQSAKSSLEKSAKSSLEKSAKSSLEKSVPVSIDRRKHPHILPLVEYGAQGQYVVISPEEGLLSFKPDSPEWFAWLSTLPSFRFVGQQGRFTAFRGYQCSPGTSWWAHRQIRNHSHRRRLGLPASVTMASLELAASSLQALV